MWLMKGLPSCTSTCAAYPGVNSVSLEKLAALYKSGGIKRPTKRQKQLTALAHVFSSAWCSHNTRSPLHFFASTWHAPFLASQKRGMRCEECRLHACMAFHVVPMQQLSIELTDAYAWCMCRHALCVMRGPCPYQ